MIKINTAFSKKIPGEEQYSSEGYHCSLEVEVSDAVLNNANTLKEKIAGMFQEVKSNVEAQINNNGQHVNNGQHAEDERASEKQKNFIASLARRRHGMDSEELDQWIGNGGLQNVNRTRASDLITQLKGGGL